MSRKDDKRTQRNKSESRPMTPKQYHQRNGSKISKQNSKANSDKRVKTTRFSKSRSLKNFKGFESSAEKSKKSLRSNHSKLSRKSLKSMKSQLKVNEASNKELRQEIKRLLKNIQAKEEIVEEFKFHKIKYRELLNKLEKSEMHRREQAEKVKI